jgi:hypothetical protein
MYEPTIFRIQQATAPSHQTPYYGQIMVASALRQFKNTRVVNIPLWDRLCICQLQQRSTVEAGCDAANQTTSGRPRGEYKFHVPRQHESASVECLIGLGNDALDNITLGSTCMILH